MNWLALLCVLLLPWSAWGLSLMWDYAPLDPQATDDAEGFVMFRRVGTTGTPVEVGRMPRNTLSWTETFALVQGTTYCYYVVAYNTTEGAEQHSDPSNQLCVVRRGKPRPPLNLR